MTPKTNRRWMQTALQGAATAGVAMPWQRGLRRAAMLARRKAEETRPVPAQRRSMAAC